MSAFLRSTILADREVVLRAVLIDQDSRHLMTYVVARGEKELSAFDASGMFDASFTVGAAGIILVRGVQASGDDRVSLREVDQATSLRRAAERAGIHVLDYVVVTATSNHGLFAVSEGERAAVRNR